MKIFVFLWESHKIISLIKHFWNMSCILVDGVWQPWSLWDSCNITCGGGGQNRYRTCIQPQFGGAPCNGSDIDYKDCNTHHCPGNASYTETYICQRYHRWSTFYIISLKGSNIVLLYLFLCLSSWRTIKNKQVHLYIHLMHQLY